MKPIAVDLPYPSVDDITYDTYSASIIYPAFIGAHSELGATIQYIYNNISCLKGGNEKAAQTFMGIAICEMEHFHILGETLTRLGAENILADYPQCAKPNYSLSVNKMILESIAGELVAIETYSQMVNKLKNERVSAIITRIILDEKMHVTVLKELLNSQENK